jgi:hypothetical protein
MELYGIKSSWIVVYLGGYVLTGLGQLLQLKVAGLLFIWGVCVDWLGTVTSIKSRWIPPQINNNPATFNRSNCPKPVNTYPPDKQQSTYFLLK